MIPDGLPPAYEVMASNTQDETPPRDFPQRIETQFGKIRRSWVMDCGVLTKELPAKMRASETPCTIWWGTPRGRLDKMEQNFLSQP